MKKYISILLTLTMVLSPLSAYSVTIELNTSFKIRSFNDGEMERVGMLRKGSQLEIPDEYAVYRNGKVNFELTVNQWLRKSGQMSKGAQATDNGTGLYKFDGQKHDYFFPIKVKKMAPGSTYIGDGKQSVYIALRALTKRNRAIVLNTNTPVYSAPRYTAERTRSPERPQVRAVPPRYLKRQTQEIRQPQPRLRANTEAGIQDYCESCRETGPLRDLLNDLPVTLAKVQRSTDRNRRRITNELRSISSRFERSCGINFNDFKNEIRREFNNDEAQVDLMVKLMSQESSARCQIRNSEADRSASVGLFQINTRSSRYPRCNSAQKQALQYASIETMRTQYQCLENPIVNLRESKRILLEKESSLARAGFDFGKIKSNDRLRMILSAYNGGQKWVKIAKKDLEEFNRKHGTKLSHNNWEDLRIFYLRRALTKDEQYQHFGSHIKRRLVKFSVSNLAYAEAIVPRERTLASN